MTARDHPPGNRDPSEVELRVMLEARELELEQERQRTSRKFTLILTAFAITTAAAVLFFPSGGPAPPAETPLAAIPLPASVDPGNAKPDPGIPAELRKFTIQPGESDHAGDLRFASQLLNFMNPAGPAPPPPTKAAVPKSDR